MIQNNFKDNDLRSAGYQALIDHFDLEVIPNWHQSYISSGGKHQQDVTSGYMVGVFPAVYWPGEEICSHLEFALKYDGTNPAILAKVFEVMSQRELVAYIQSKPLGKYARRLWYFYELLMGERLPIDDLKAGAYIDLLESNQYYTISESISSRRHKVNNNLLGTENFCPMIRKTEALQFYDSKNLIERCREVIAQYPESLLRRALSYLYTKETKSSFEIEHINHMNTNRVERFIALLELAETEDFCDKHHFVELQNRIVDPRYKENDYREKQNYVGQSIAWQHEKVHYACPKPEDINQMMDGLVEAHLRMENNSLPPVIHAAAVAYGFVFLHPFEDGNGRIHRFLIHNILARRGFTPEGLMFPVSAVMLRHMKDYDASLEAFSKALMPLVDYDMDDQGRMTVNNETRWWYCWLDMTDQAEALYRFIETTIETELTRELDFLSNYDETRQAVQSIVDMPDRQIDLIIKCCLQNYGKLSERKRSSHFDELTEEEIKSIEDVVSKAYGKDDN